jgi:peptidoglycan/LPS O-acetylase OafA/YrhL
MLAQSRASPAPNPGPPATASFGPPLNLHGHLPALDGIRGLAILMVLVFHFVGSTLPTNWVESAIIWVGNHGAMGVNLFFVLSGFLITGILYDAHNGPSYFRNFYMRRVLRIFPLYYGVLALVFFVAPLVPLLRGPTLDYLLDRQAWAWLYAVNIYIAKTGDWSFSYLEHFWSLAVEEHFYLFWPLVVLLLARRPRALIAASLAIALCAVVARFIAFLMGLSWWTIVVLTPFNLDGLAMGAALAVALRQPKAFEQLARVLPWAAVMVVALLALTYVWKGPLSSQGIAPVLPIRTALFNMLFLCLLFWALIAPGGSVTARFFCSRTMVFLGTYSYGLYVYHHFISYYLYTNRTELELTHWLGSHGAAVALQATLGAAASLALAYLSYELFEKRFLRLKQLFTATKPTPELPAIVGLSGPLKSHTASTSE